MLSNNGTDRYKDDIVLLKPAKVFILYVLNYLRYNVANFSLSAYQIDLNKVCVVIYVNMKKLVVIYIKKCFEFKTFFLIVMDRGLY